MVARKKNQGASLVETALILPILILILAGVGDLGRAFHDYIVIHNASREGARYASHFFDRTPEIKQVTIQEAATTGVNLTESMVKIESKGYISPTELAAGTPITVIVEYPFRPVLTRLIGKDVITLTARTRMVVFGYDL